MPETVYTAEALSTGGGRDGHVRSADGSIDVDLRVPRELGGAGGAANPEILFASGYAGCFHSALLGAARTKKVKIEGSSVGARVGLQHEDGSVGLVVHLEVVLPDVPAELAHELALLAHATCPYSKAVRGNIEVTIAVSDD